MRKFISSGDFVEDQFIGRKFERLNDFENAIKAYECAEKSSIKAWGSPPPNIYERQAIIYRKLKDYNSEINIIKKALNYYPDSKPFAYRLERAKKLSKSKINKK
ncbi:MAG: hypothetical protein ABF991_12420 [Liquorilactobacillus hordei]|uniref:Uncharacterized protein n=1 Tax=Liquorilactobacillus hordei TaxID=468911 RepID=A0A3Q8CXA5_9LACO|nr:hypothetical protein [Liquorilactobacillus hordei]AUJ29404.1 hypothetical protein BSQ49_03825 [Liquorilactobacillus hordei]MBZ2405338.1 hypothetical protein [Liquorilactobacillus hordei]